MSTMLVMGLLGAMAAGAIGPPLGGPDRERPRRDPIRDAAKIEEAKGKRAKKAAKRARAAARNAGGPP